MECLPAAAIAIDLCVEQEGASLRVIVRVL